MSQASVAIVGATGLVGREMLKVLEERNFPAREIRLLASARSAGRTMVFNDTEVEVEQLGPDSFSGVDIALFSAGSTVSKEFGPRAVAAGAVVIDNSSAFRMTEGVPLVVPEVNGRSAKDHNGIIANPNCSTIQLVVVLWPIEQAVGLDRVVVATYQSVSGTGKEAMLELEEQARAVLRGRDRPAETYPHRIAFNVLPQCDSFQESGYTLEEAKLMRETKKIMARPNLNITATAARVPVFISHSEAVNVVTGKKLSADACRDLLERAPGVEIADSPEASLYPMAADAAGTDPVWVGRIREDQSAANGLDMWIVADNLRKGAALNAVQIAEGLTSQRSL